MKKTNNVIIKEETVSFKDDLHFGVDISKGPGSSYRGNKFWILIVDIKKLEEGGTDIYWS